VPELICTVNVATSAGWLYFSAGVVFLYTRVARFVKREYRQTTSASRLVSELGWQSLAKRCKTSPHFALQSLVAIPMDDLYEYTHQGLLGTVDQTHLSSCHHVWMPTSFLFFFWRTVSHWNSLPSSIRSKSSVNSRLPYVAYLASPETFYTCRFIASEY